MEQGELEEGKPYFNAMREKENRERNDWIEKSKAVESFRSAEIEDWALINQPGTTWTEE